MSDISYLNQILSGGASNIDPTASIGGAISTQGAAVITSQSTTATTTITGVTIDNAAGNEEGQGTLSFNSSSTSLTWSPPGGFSGEAVDVSVNGTYAITGGGGLGDGYLEVTVVVASLPGQSETNNITITQNANVLFDDVTKTESRDGATSFRCFYLKWDHGTETAYGGKLWIEVNTIGQDTVAVALGGAINSTAVTIADEFTAPAGADFDSANPIDASTGLDLGDLTPGDSIPVWIRRVVPAGVSVAQDNNLFILATQVEV